MKETMKIYGPYTRNDKRQHIIIIHDDGKRQTKSYPRHILEQHLGRELLPLETVDHIDNDFTNNSLENLQILTLVDNILKERIRHSRLMFEFICPCCKELTKKPLNYVKHNKVQNKTGPFCSRRCAGKFNYKNPWTKSVRTNTASLA